MSLTDKMDAIDLIITALKEHEKRLDDVVARLEEVTASAEEADS